MGGSAEQDTGDEVVGPDDLLLATCGGVLVIDGPIDAIERFRSGSGMLDRATPVDSNNALLAAAAGALAGVLDRPGSSQQLFKLDSIGQALFEQGKLDPSSVGRGFVRATSHGTKGFGDQASLMPVDFAPQRLLSAQMALTTVALTAAIKEVQAAVERVEHKVDRLNDLLSSMLAGEVIGAHEALARRAMQIILTGAMADADWASLHAVGVQVEQQVATIRTYVRKRLRAAAEEGMGVKDRRDAIEQVEQITEVLGLLAVAQHSLFLFQAIRLQRLRSHEPEHLAAGIEEAVGFLERHAAGDRQLLEECRSIVADRLEIGPLEIYRYLSARDVVRLARQADESLEWFADQRTLEYDALPASVLPTVGQAVDEIRERGGDVTDSARVAGDVALQRIRRWRDRRIADPDEGAIEPGDDESDVKGASRS